MVDPQLGVVVSTTMGTASPFGVFTEDLEVPAAIDSGGRLVPPASRDAEELKRLCKAGELRCPAKACESPDLIYVAGLIRHHHYRHVSKGFGHDAESLAHLTVKHAICNRARALGYLADVEQGFGDHVSDVFVHTPGGLSIEVQFSPETVGRWREREAVRARRHSGSQWVWGQPTTDEARTFLTKQKAAQYLERLPLVDLWFARLSTDGEPQIAKAREASGWECETSEVFRGVRKTVNLELRWISASEIKIEPKGLVDAEYLSQRAQAIEAETTRRAQAERREQLQHSRIRQHRPFPDSQSRKGQRGFQIGDQITHNKWGDGTVLDLRGSGEKTEIVVQFATAGEKTLLAAWAPVELAVTEEPIEFERSVAFVSTDQVVISAEDQAKWAKLLHRADRRIRHQLLDLYMKVRAGAEPVSPPSSIVQEVCNCEGQQHDNQCPMFGLDWPTSMRSNPPR